REICFARDRLHVLRREPAGVGDDRELIAFERTIGEDVHQNIRKPAAGDVDHGVMVNGMRQRGAGPPRPGFWWKSFPLFLKQGSLELPAKTRARVPGSTLLSDFPISLNRVTIVRNRIMRMSFSVRLCTCCCQEST